MFIVLLGAPGSGKGTVAEVLSQTQENETVAELASINCLVCQKYSERLKYARKTRVSGNASGLHVTTLPVRLYAFWMTMSCLVRNGWKTVMPA